MTTESQAGPAPARARATVRRGRWVALVLPVLLLLPALAPHSATHQDREAVLQAPSHRYWLGTDDYGRDQLSRLLVATRDSVVLATAMALPPLLLALFAGLGAALRPRSAGAWRAAGEICRGLPWLFLLVAVRAALPLGASLPVLVLVLIALFTLAAWPLAAWTFQGAAEDIVRQDFILAARLLGVDPGRMMRRHLWPNLRPLTATYFALLFAAAVGAEVSLALAGLGVPASSPTWGNMLLPLREVTLARQAWWLYAPLGVFAPLLAYLTWTGQKSAVR